MQKPDDCFKMRNMLLTSKDSPTNNTEVYPASNHFGASSAYAKGHSQPACEDLGRYYVRIDCEAAHVVQ
jgi:hypothetical protein